MYGDYISEYGINEGIKYHLWGELGSRICFLQTPEGEYACVWSGRLPPTQKTVAEIRERGFLHSKIEMLQKINDFSDYVDVVEEMLKLNKYCVEKKEVK